MEDSELQAVNELAAHLFRIEYGKIVSVLTKFTGIQNLDLAEDIAQETFLRAVKSWQNDGLPPNPKGWLYVTAKNEFLNRAKKSHIKRKHQHAILNRTINNPDLLDVDFSDEIISDEQLKMMFACCHNSISINAQLCLILKVLGGFSISEIAKAFFTSTETINKRLVRARKQLRSNQVSFELPSDISAKLPTVLKAIYLLFNEGYAPIDKGVVIRKDLCFEAIRLVEILKDNDAVANKGHCYSLLSLMYLNVSRFTARISESNEVIQLKDQDRKKWNRQLINIGITYLNKNVAGGLVSTYSILAAISANHCTAAAFEDTNWEEILNLYDALTKIEDSPIIQLNRCVAIAQVRGNEEAIATLVPLAPILEHHYLFHSTLATFYSESNHKTKARSHLKKAIELSSNNRDIVLLEKKLANLVPI